MKNKFLSIMEKLHLTQSQMAGILGIAQPSYSQLESGTRSPSMKTYRRLQNNLFVNLEYLEDKSDVIFTVKEPLLSERIDKMMVFNKVDAEYILKDHPSEIRKTFTDVMKNYYLPDSSFIRKLFSNLKGFDVDYILEGKLWYKDQERDFSSVTHDPGIDYIPKDQYLRDLDAQKEVGRVYQKIVLLQEKRIE